MVESLASNEFFYLGLILLFPLLGAAINGLIGKRLPRQAVWFIACSGIGLSFVFSLLSVAAMIDRSQLARDPAAVQQLIREARQKAVEENTDTFASATQEGADAANEKPNATLQTRSDEAALSMVEAVLSAPHAIIAPRLEYTVFDWIVSGDWAGDGGWQPTSLFEAAEPMESAYLKVSPPPKGGDLSEVDEHGNPVQREQKGIGSVTSKLRGSAHLFSGLKVRLGLALDQLSAIMILIITGVGLLIHIYSIGYMRHDPSKYRYFSYLNLFCFSMLLLVLGSNLVVLFVGWEGVGLCSYLLIGYYYQDHANADAGKKAFIVNRVGDFAFILGMLTLFLLFGTFEFEELRAAVDQGTHPYVEYGMITLACVLLFIGCTGKSAQIPLYVWLPDAMAGPTPVSALIHAATMVTAGIYLIARLNFIFVLAPTAMAIIAIVGALTAFVAATIAVVQTDIKKVLAYSTVSQLGYMFLGIGVGAWWAAVFHLMTHAFFKALLFLGSGSVIDAMHHEQDIGKMGGLRKYMPVTALTFLIGCAAIAGVPLLSGFFSKDGILWYAWFNQNPAMGGFAPYFSWMLWLLGVATAGLTAFYMFRLYFRTFEGRCRADDHTRAHITESPTSMTVPLVALAVLSIAGGYVGLPHVLNFVHSPGLEALPLWLQSTLYSAVDTRALDHGTEVLMEWALMGASVAVAFAGIAAAFKLYYSPMGDPSREPSSVPAELLARFPRAHRVLMNKYYVDELYAFIFIRGTLAVGKYAFAIIDRVLIDIFMVRLGGWIYQGLGHALKSFQNGDMQRYATYVVLGLLAVVYMVLF